MFVNLTHNPKDSRVEGLMAFLAGQSVTVHQCESREELISASGRYSGYDYDAVLMMPNNRNMIGDMPASTLFSLVSKLYPSRAYIGLISGEIFDPLSARPSFQKAGEKNNEPRTLLFSKKSPPGLLYSERNVMQVVKLLEGGADDVVRLEDQQPELFARMLAVRARKIGARGSSIDFGNMTVHLDEPLVTVHGNDIGLTRTEYAIVKYMAMRPTKACSRPEILEALGKDHLEADKVIDVFICKIRQKIAEATGGVNNIKTVWGQGTVLEALDSPVKAAEHLGLACQAAPSGRILTPS